MARLTAQRPRFGTRETELLARQIGVCFAAYGLYYIVWRAGWTLNLSALWLALPLLIAEAMGYIDFLLFLFMSWHIPELKALPPPKGLSVDAYITTYNESTEILRSTILGAVHMRYPHETYVLDDGARAEVAALAKSLGARYIARTEHAHAKAGNINDALSRTSGDFVAVFDADHVPHPQFLERTLQYFEDERVALVQTPQEFYNLDSIQHAGARRDGEAHWHEQALFYRVIQAGKDRSNAAFWCGSSAVLRRTALESIGGVATETITEDILTTIKLHGAGWRTAYHNEILATGIAPDDLDAFLTQRKRWAQGAMQILRSRYNPLWAKGLTMRQRLSYWASMSTYFASFQKLVLLLTPLVVLGTGILPMRAFGWDFAAHFVPYFVLGLAANSLCGRSYGRYFDTERFNLLKAFAFVRASLALVIPRALRFEVTRKSQQVRPAREVLAALPHLTLLVSSICAMGWAAYEVLAHGVGGSQQLALELTAVWAVYNAGIVGLAIRAVLSRSHRRARYRFARRVPLIVEELYPPARYQVSSTDMTPDGLSFTHAAVLPRGTPVVVELDLPGGAQLHSSAVVMNSVPLDGGGPFRVGVQFTELSDGDRDALTLYLFTGETDHMRVPQAPEQAAA